MNDRVLVRSDGADGILASCVPHNISVTSKKFDFIADLVQGLGYRFNRELEGTDVERTTFVMLEKEGGTIKICW
jgi:hypothetical protein